MMTSSFFAGEQWQSNQLHWLGKIGLVTTDTSAILSRPTIFYCVPLLKVAGCTAGIQDREDAFSEIENEF